MSHKFWSSSSIPLKVTIFCCCWTIPRWNRWNTMIRWKLRMRSENFCWKIIGWSKSNICLFEWKGTAWSPSWKAMCQQLLGKKRRKSFAIDAQYLRVPSQVLSNLLKLKAKETLEVKPFGTKCFCRWVRRSILVEDFGVETDSGIPVAPNPWDVFLLVACYFTTSF